MNQDTFSTSTLSEYRNLIRIPSECCDILLDPLEGPSLIGKADIGVRLLGVQESQITHSIIGHDSDSIRRAGHVRPIVERETFSALLYNKDEYRSTNTTQSNRKFSIIKSNVLRRDNNCKNCNNIHPEVNICVFREE